jgi:membrane AbrB-like protein
VTPPSARLLARWTATLAVAALGGGVAFAVGAPLPWMLGGLFATGVAAAGGLRPLGDDLAFPHPLRLAFIPVIGVLIGSAATPALAAAAPGWWPAMIAVPLFVVAAHGGNYLLMRRAGLDKPTAFFAGMPGGLIESIELGAKSGADLRALTVLQFARIAITVTAVPLIFSLIEGRAVGSAAGESFGAAAPITWRDAGVMLFCGVVGLFGAQALRLPAGQITGPVVLSALAHLAGLTEAAPPAWLAAVAQTVIGASLGVRFTGADGALLRRCLALSALSVGYMLALAGLFAVGLALIDVARPAASVLALSPGGVIEMGLVALSLQASPIYVTLLHIVRILVTVWLATWLWGRLKDPDAP